MEANTSVIIDEAARRRFEAAWRSGSPPVIDPFLPPPDDPAWLATLVELVFIDIEMRWKRRQATGEPADLIEDYIQRFPALSTPKTLHALVQHEFGVRQRTGDKPVEADYEARFPALLDSRTLRPSVVDGPTGFMDAMAAPKIAGYEIERLLGRGGMGVVFLARQTRLKRHVALKMILAGPYADADDLARFRGEAESIARLQHPNIVHIYEIGEAGDRPYFSMEYAGGGSLSQFLNGTPLSPHIAAGLVRTLANAVHYAHQNGVLHRDLKPANVLFAVAGTESESASGKQAASQETHKDEPEKAKPDDNQAVPPPRLGTSQFAVRTPKISDFGLAKQMDANDDRTKTGTILGTPSYMAPEQASGQWRDVGPAADIYALGAILYECLTGRPPFKAPTALETLEQVRTQEPVPPRQLQPKTPRDLETICLKCLEKPPTKRYATAADLAGDLTRYLSHEPILARRIGPIGRAWRWGRRKPYQAALIALSAAAAISLIAGLFLWQRADFRKQQQILGLQSEQQAESRRQLAVRRRTAELNQQRALAEVAANRFDTAEQFLQQALDQTNDGEGLEDLRGDLAKQHERVAKLNRFYQLSEKTERLAFVEHEDRAKQRCEQTLAQFEILTGDAKWWDRLQLSELTAVQTDRLLFDVNHQLMLLAAMRVKHALLNVKGDESKQAFRDALDPINRVHAFHEWRKLPPSPCALIVENVCRLSLGELGRLKKIPNADPVTASDCYFQGIAYYWLVMSPKGTLSDTIKWAFRMYGFDMSDPAGTAQTVLRRAIGHNPRHHWSYLWLGWTLHAVQDYRASELAFASCITLRPDDAIGYAERARSLALQARALTAQKLDPNVEASRRQELWRRCRADLDRAIAREPHDWYIQYRRLESLALFDEQQEALDASRGMLEAIPSPNRLVGLPLQETATLVNDVRGYLQRIHAQAPDHPEGQVVLALILLRSGDSTGAWQAANKSLSGPSNDPRVGIIRSTALFVHGHIALQRGQAAEALRLFDEALALRPKYFHAALGRASAIALAGDRAAALSACDAAAALAGNDWQHLEVHIERIAAYLSLGRESEARQELQKAWSLYPTVADEYRRLWFDD